MRVIEQEQGGLLVGTLRFEIIPVYLETVVEGTGIYVGSITYRSYLGQDAISDFDIRRNSRYNWRIQYLKDGLQYNDWKHDNDLIDTQSGLHIDDGWDDGGEEELH